MAVVVIHLHVGVHKNLPVVLPQDLLLHLDKRLDRGLVVSEELPESGERLEQGFREAGRPYRRKPLLLLNAFAAAAAAIVSTLLLSILHARTHARSRGRV